VCGLFGCSFIKLDVPVYIPGKSIPLPAGILLSKKVGKSGMRDMYAPCPAWRKRSLIMYFISARIRAGGMEEGSSKGAGFWP